jgi:hypothetical protein
MLRNPAAAKYSISATVDTVMPTDCSRVARRATSTDFAVFMWGRNWTSSPVARPIIRSQLRSTRSRSRINAGVGRSSRDMPGFQLVRVHDGAVGEAGCQEDMKAQLTSR